MFGIYLQMYNLHLKIRVKTKVSGVEMILIPFRRRLMAFDGVQLGHGRKKSLTEIQREASCSCQCSLLSFYTAGGVPLFVSAGVL